MLQRLQDPADPPPHYRNSLQRAYSVVDGQNHRFAPEEWAEDMAATIPFVGKHYGTIEGAPRLLIYASAENIRTADHKSSPWRGTSEQARLGQFDRHHFTWCKGYGDIAPGKQVGIAPFEEGPLLAAAALLWDWELLGSRTLVPRPAASDESLEAQAMGLTEAVAVANFSKFAPRHQGKNIDPNAERLLRDSLGYVQADLECLKPTVMLLAKTLDWSITAEVAQYAARRECLVVVMPQVGQGVSSVAGRLAKMGFDSSKTWAAPDLHLGGDKKINLNTPSLGRWYALLHARYEAALACLPSPTPSPPVA